MKRLKNILTLAIIGSMIVFAGCEEEDSTQTVSVSLDHSRDITSGPDFILQELIVMTDRRKVNRQLAA